MTSQVLNALFDAYRSSQGPSRIFCADYDGAVSDAFSSMGVDVYSRLPMFGSRRVEHGDLWFDIPPEHFRLTVLEKQDSAKELFRVLAHLDRMTVRGGSICIVCRPVNDDSSYHDAVESFTSAYEGRTFELHLASNVYQITKQKAA
jgi:hypothetical protein